MAINRASPKYLQKSLLEFSKLSESSPFSIFISYKSDDLEAAKKIGDYILNYASIDIYLDYNDARLQGAVDRGDDKKIVECIEEGLKKSTHLLCLISDKTSTSWWVPYEIGMAKSQNKDIASMKLKSINDVPSFLKIERVIMGTKSFNEYLEEIINRIILNEVTLPANSTRNHPLDNVLSWQE